VVSSSPACLPPAGLPGLEPHWSRLVSAQDDDGVLRTWHVLDTHAGRATADVRLTVLCVHGNPTWSYLWRRVLATAPADVRVIAVDHLDMGYSERTGTTRPLARRIRDLGVVVDALQVAGGVVVVAHDWGGPISLGWVLQGRADVVGVALLNTAVHQPAGSSAPSVIRLARAGAVRHAATVATPAFVRGTTLLSGRRMPRDVAEAFAAPYSSAERRVAVGEFVADIPLEDDHTSAQALAGIAEGVRGLTIPMLLLWGPGDPVFSDRYLHDLEERVPHAEVHRYTGARHLVIEDAPALVDDLWTWIDDVARRDLVTEPEPETETPAEPLWAALDQCAAATPDAVALAEPVDGAWRAITWGHLARNVRDLAAGLADSGIRRGDRVSVLIPVGADLVAVIYACWRIGASVVVTDAGLGARGMIRALRSAAPDHVIAIPRGVALVRGARLGVRGQVVPVSRLAAIARHGASLDLPAPPEPDDEALVAFTSGSTGPAKGVVYAHRQVQRTRDLLRDHYRLTSADSLVAAFAPWAVLGPALGIASAIPDMDLTDASTLNASTAGRAAAAVGPREGSSGGVLMWTSPTALRAILDTAGSAGPDERAALERLRLLLVAGAPVPADLLARAQEVMPEAVIATPYGMTEALPLTEVRLEELLGAQSSDGVLVGRPLAGVDVAIAPLDSIGRPAPAASEDELVSAAGVTGEIVVRCAWMRSRYDRRWATQAHADSPPGWHRTADVGHLDGEGRLWVEGRLAHVIATPRGAVTPVGPEMVAQAVSGVARAACVGVGPRGTQSVVVVLEEGDARGLELVDIDTTIGVRRAVLRECGVDVAAVLRTAALPVDIRHRSKIDRAAVARDASRLLAGDLEVADG